MVFSSHIFIFYFLPLVLAAYYAVPQRYRNGLLCAASYVFYGWWNPWFVLLMLASTVIDYRCGQWVTAPDATDSQRRRAVTVSVVANLSLLGFFKYWMFFADNVNGLLATVGGEGPWQLPVWQIVLPVGISFYTFQSMSYTIDLYRGQARPASTLLDFAAYVSLFPQLVAGPIVRYRDVAEQLPERTHDAVGMARGLSYFVFGLAKKVLLANNLGLVADTVFAAQAPPWHVAWVGVMAYAGQIYFDFSGYSDMAIGLGQLFGFRFPQNFRSPYRAASITEFWRRWHISLSSWLRDYLYIPLGGNRKGPGRTYLHLAITMLLGGLWHGAQWQFIVWGGLHGLFLAVERWRGKGSLMPAAPRVVQQIFTFVLVLITWVFFRAADLGSAIAYLQAMFAMTPVTAASQLVAGQVYSPWSLGLLVVAYLIIARAPRTEQWVDGAVNGVTTLFASPRRVVAVVGLFLLALMEMSVQGHNPFLYFQF